MSSTAWTDVDEYVADLLIGRDENLAEALQACEDAGLPPISVSAAQGQFLNLLATIQGAGKILEIGTLGGYSTIWLGRALPADGTLVTLEVDPTHAAVAESNVVAAGLGSRVDIRVGNALETLPQLEVEGAGPFDLVFIDADKPSIPEYVTWALRLARSGAVIVVDNVVRGGAVLDSDSDDPTVRGVRAMNELIAAEPRLTATVLQTVGSKGYDGFALAVVDAKSA
ncbi:Predicted O-methyltransferase YrrM [Haloechinothrix alba]|uniref:Predicted O-methyltransferase YrrM n=1 Tax=Haloechinothrix alba TaxID=664784 RepID=A0A238X2F6_9PSEU|nr:O-methyltransferase [Haloechinothrix alba]SNR52019.1 Predicted O-methyltransferase YrrM [Haloechinothrix alba]